MGKDMEKTYLFVHFIQKALIHEKLNYIRNNKKKQLEILMDDEFLLDISAHESNLIDEIKMSDVSHLEEYIDDLNLSNSIAQLSTNEKLILFKRYVQGKKDTEIAKELNITSQAVSKRRRIILKKLKNKFQI
ncbi:sigma factor-like helix-turn-helix DNA-binding protein [Enterococcus sp. DIV2315]|uniref:sigma factor-like helix-turn-helix DNA-binding protein n=1 Tax=Enterococcus sp. DIV2315 TaxID=2774765 RepID=UPI003D2FC328